MVSQEVSDLWKAIPLRRTNDFGDFTPQEFAVALQRLKPGKAPGPDSISSKLVIHAGAELKYWLHDFHSSCLRHLKIPKT